MKAGVRDFTELVGSGPFMPVAYARNDALILRANPHYYEAGLPNLYEVRIYVRPERAAQVAAFRAGELDYLGFPYSQLPALTLEEALQASNSGADFAPHPVVYALWFDTQSPPVRPSFRAPCSTLRHRPPRLWKVCWGRASSQSSIPDALFPEWSTRLDAQSAVERWHAYDPEKARELLAELGYHEGFDTVMHVPEGVTRDWDSMIDAILLMLADVGIDVELESVPQGEFFTTPAERGIKLTLLQGFGGDVRAFSPRALPGGRDL